MKNNNIIIKPYISFVYTLTTNGYTKSISKSNNKNNNANIKKVMLNCVLFCPKKEWNPHSNTLSFSWYGLCGANIKFINNNIMANNGIKIKKKVLLVIYILNIINVNIFAILNHSCGINKNINIMIVNIDIVKLR